MTVIPFPAELTGVDPSTVRRCRQVERRYRAILALRLGLSHDDIRCVFDLTEADLARLAAEVAQ